jgi:hypothetical protein
MSQIKSIFGAYATKLQVAIDNSLDQFAPTWFQNYFSWGPQQMSLTFESVIGRSRIEAAASIIARGSRAPLRSRKGLEKLTGYIPQIAEKFALSEADYRDFLTLQQLNTDDNAKTQQLLDLMFGDVTKVGNAAMKRLDIMCLEGISTGYVSLTVSNNPDGLVLQDSVPLLMPDDNFQNAAVSWDSTSGTPFTDILNVVNAAQARGISFAKILMTRNRFFKMIRTTEVKDYVGNFINLRNTQKTLPTLQQVNDYLTANLLPGITIVDEAIGIESDGVISTLRPFKDENVVFIPAGNLGVIKHAVCVEELRPVENVAYSKFNNALISKYAENEPFQEFTKVELNAFPAVDAIDSIYILLSTTVSSS